MRINPKKFRVVFIYLFAIIALILIGNEGSAEYQRTGAICRDNWRSSATGRGACSHHGGVKEWTYKLVKPKAIPDDIRNIGLLVLGFNGLLIGGTFLIPKPKAKIPFVLSIYYDPTTRILEIAINSEGVFEYYEVPYEVWKELKESKSQYSYYEQNIKNIYDNLRLGDD